jgi:uncharacterized protein
MTLQYKQDSERFYVCNDNNQEIAEVAFTRIGQDKATINHTYTVPNYRGQGIADQLLELVINKLRQEKREIIPLCSFAASKLVK